MGSGCLKGTGVVRAFKLTSAKADQRDQAEKKRNERNYGQRHANYLLSVPRQRNFAVDSPVMSWQEYTGELVGTSDMA